MTNDDDSSSSSNFVPIAPATKKRTYLSTEEELQQISEAICMETLNNRNFESPWIQYLAPDVVAIHETTPVATGRDELIANLKATVESMPNYYVDILSTTATVNERKGTATVYLHLFLNGMPDGMRRESVNVLEWERNAGEWLIKKHSGMRGPVSDLEPFSGY